jgi:hypothetical protein
VLRIGRPKLNSGAPKLVARVFGGVVEDPLHGRRLLTGPTSRPASFYRPAPRRSSLRPSPVRSRRRSAPQRPRRRVSLARGNARVDSDEAASGARCPTPHVPLRRPASSALVLLVRPRRISAAVSLSFDVRAPLEGRAMNERGSQRACAALMLRAGPRQRRGLFHDERSC